MQAAAFLKSLQSAEPPPALLLVGPERMLAQRILQRIAGALQLDEDDRSSWQRVDAAQTILQSILDSANTATLLAPRRLLEVRNAGAIAAPAGSPQLAALERYLRSPNPDTILAFVADSVNRAHQPFKLLSRLAQFVDCAPLRGAPLRGWISQHVSRRGYALPPGGEQHIEETLGTDMTLIAGALDKVMLFCGQRRQIEFADLEKTIGVGREHMLWELTDAISARDAATALAALAALLDEGKHPLLIVASLAGQFRRLLTVRSMLARRAPEQSIIQAAGLRYRPEKTFRQARGFSVAELERACRLMFEVENSLKGAGGEERFALESCIIKVCRSGAA